MKTYETLVAETDARFSEAEVVFKERQQQQHSFSRSSIQNFRRSFSVLTDLRRSRAVDKKLRELMAMFYTQPVVCAPAYAGKFRQSLFDSFAGAAARVHGRFAAPGRRQIKCFSGLWIAKRASAARASVSLLFSFVFFEKVFGLGVPAVRFDRTTSGL